MNKKKRNRIFQIVLWFFAVFGILNAIYWIWQIGIWVIQNIKIEIVG